MFFSKSMLYLMNCCETIISEWFKWFSHRIDKSVTLVSEVGFYSFWSIFECCESQSREIGVCWWIECENFVHCRCAFLTRTLNNCWRPRSRALSRFPTVIPPLWLPLSAITKHSLTWGNIKTPLGPLHLKSMLLVCCHHNAYSQMTTVNNVSCSWLETFVKWGYGENGCCVLVVVVVVIPAMTEESLKHLRLFAQSQVKIVA